MKKLYLCLALICAFLGAIALQADARRSPRSHNVRSYTRKDGTFVSAHRRGSGSGSSSRRSRARSWGGGAAVGAGAMAASSGSEVLSSSPTTGEFASQPAQDFSGMSTHIAGPASSATTETLPDTGGNPLLMAFGGLLTAAAAFSARRRIK